MYHSFWYIDPDPFYELEPTEYRKNPMQICSRLPASLPRPLLVVANHSFGGPRFHHSNQAPQRNWQITRKLFFFP